jgi:5-methylcytosine-specific restriction endonuclease McrA
MSVIATCIKCGKIIHKVNKRYCCGIDYSKPVKPSSHPTIEEMKASVKKKRKAKSKKLPKKIRIAVLERDNHECTQCSATDPLEVHHIVYRSQGGTDELDNLTTLCEPCHTAIHINEPIYKVRMKRSNVL